jgi:beta-galactosidase
MPVGAAFRLIYTINGKGTLQIEMQYIPLQENLPLMPKVGMRMRIPSEYSQIEWYGRGPWENYPDRKTGYFIGQYSMSLEDFKIDYASPQDNSNRSDVRWLSFSRPDRRGLRVRGLQELNFRAWPYSEEDLEAGTHPHDLPTRDYININIDYKIHGVGGNDGWGARTMDEYTIDANQAYSFGFILERY